VWLSGSGDITAGLVVFGMDYAYVAVRRKANVTEIIQARAMDAPSGARERVDAVVRANASAIQLRVTVSDSAQCQFAYSVNGRHWLPIGEPFTAQKGRWEGAKVGLFASNAGKDAAHADFHTSESRRALRCHPARASAASECRDPPYAHPKHATEQR
jgi:Beta xylosidase C-terminal Concanavalin A-like domain